MGIDALKICTVCKTSQPLRNYYASKRSADGKGYRCKSCDDEARMRNRAKSPGTRLGYRRRTLAGKYGLTLEDYDAMLKRQEGRCAICRTDNPVGEGNTHSFKDYSFAVDHDHETGKVRGLLCNPCNRGLGFLKDNPATVFNAFTYLARSCH